MDFQTSTLADRVSHFLENGLLYLRSAAATAAGAAVIALSSTAAAQAPAPVPAAAPAATSPTPAAPASPPRQYLPPELQSRIDAFKEFCDNPTSMGWLTRYAVRCDGVDEQSIKLRLDTPVERPDKQEKRQWELYKFGDVTNNFDFLVNPETLRIMAEGIADLHNTAVHAKNPRAAPSDLLDPSLMDIVSVGANGVGGSRLEVVYDIDKHKDLYKKVGAAVNKRVKQRYGFNTPVWNHQETLVLDVELLTHMDLQAIRAKISSEQSRQASTLEMYGKPGTVVFEKVDTATGAVSGVFEAKNQVFELEPGVYVTRSKDAENFTPLVDFNGDGSTDLGNAFELSPGWNGTIRLRNQYTGTERLAPDVRRSIENEAVYSVRVAQPAAGAPAAVTAVPPPTTSPATTPHAAPGTAPPTTDILTLLNVEAAGMFVPLGPHFAISAAPGYGILSLVQTFEESGYEARSNATGPSIAGSIGGMVGEGNGLALLFDVDYFRISNGSGTVTQRGNDVGGFTYDGSWRTMAAEAAYVRLLNDNRSEPEQSATRRNAYLGLRAERATAEISGTNITANEQTTDVLLAIVGFDHAQAALDETDHAVGIRASAGVNSQSNSNGVDYDAGFSARIAADYLARFESMGLIAGADGGYNTMKTGARGQEQKRDELSLAVHGGVAYLFGDERQHRVGLNIAHNTMLADNQANGRSQLSETVQDTRAQITADFAF